MLDIKDNNFDLVRLILAVLVGFAHWNFLTSLNSESVLFDFSKIAVDSFFIISGFLIFWSYDNNSNTLFFYIKRFFRIFPLYAILIILQTLVFIIISDGSTFEVLKYFFVNIIFLNFLAPSVGTAFDSLAIDAINGSLWTLKNEVFFYLLVPLFYIIYKKIGMIFWYALYCISLIYLFVFSYLGYEKLLIQFPGQLRLFVMGILLYVLFSKLSNKNLIILSPIALFLLIYFKDNDIFHFVFYPLFLGLIVFFFIYAFIKIKIKFDFSYSFYIIHFPIIQLFMYFNINPENPFVSFVLIFSIVFVLSYLSEKYVEKGFINVGRNVINKIKSKNQ